MSQSQNPNEIPLTLSPEDAAILDTLLEHGKTTETPSNNERAALVQGWLNVLQTSPTPEPPGDLTAKTLARLQSERMKLKPAPTPARSESIPAIPSRGFRYLREIGSMAIAASLLAAVVTLGVGQARQSARRVACAGNMHDLSLAFATYATNNRNELPALAESPDHNWLTPNPTIAGSHSNSDNLMPLFNAHLIHPANLICAGRDLSNAPTPDAARGYSYVNMFAVDHPAWDNTHANIVLADRNPLFDPQTSADPQTNSINHAQRGNYVLRADGAATWETSPNIGPAHDNIWTIGSTPQSSTRFTGTETPTSEKDVFLAP